jgi:hypothetical protein
MRPDKRASKEAGYWKWDHKEKLITLNTRKSDVTDWDIRDKAWNFRSP